MHHHLALLLFFAGCNTTSVCDDEAQEPALQCDHADGVLACPPESFIWCDGLETAVEAACSGRQLVSVVVDDAAYFVYLGGDGAYPLSEDASVGALELAALDLIEDLNQSVAEANASWEEEQSSELSFWENEGNPTNAVGVQVDYDDDGTVSFTNRFPRHCAASFWAGDDRIGDRVAIAPGDGVASIWEVITGDATPDWSVSQADLPEAADALTIYCAPGPAALLTASYANLFGQDTIIAEDMRAAAAKDTELVWSTLKAEAVALFWAHFMDAAGGIAGFVSDAWECLHGFLDFHVASFDDCATDQDDEWARCILTHLFPEIIAAVANLIESCDDAFEGGMGEQLERVLAIGKALGKALLAIDLVNYVVEGSVTESLVDGWYEGGLVWIEPCEQASDATRLVFQTVGQELGVSGSCLSSSCDCLACSEDGFLRDATATNLDGVRVHLPLSALVDSDGATLRTDELDAYLGLADCLNRPLILSIALVLPNYDDAPVDSYPAAWTDLDTVSYAIEHAGIGETLIPVLWDQAFLSRYETIVDQLGAYIDGDERVDSVLIGYGLWGELVFDQRAHYEFSQGEYDAFRSEWQAQGYSEAVWLEATEAISAFYAEAFRSIPIVAQVTDPGVRIIFDESTYTADASSDFPTLQGLLESFAAGARRAGVDALQFNGLAARSTYGTDYAVYGAIEQVQHAFDIRFEAFLYSGRDTVDGCSPEHSTSGEIARDGCADPEQLQCALYRADRYDASAVTLWANEWTDADTADIITSWRLGGETSCAWCSEGARIDGNTLYVPKQFCPSDATPEFRGNLPEMTWETGQNATDAGDEWAYDLGWLPLGHAYEVSMTGCDTTWEWLSYIEWKGTCGEDGFGELIHCETGEDAGCNIHFYVDEAGDYQPCPDGACEVSISWPSIITPTGTPFEVELADEYLRGSSCAVAVGELPYWDWASGVSSHGTGPDDGFLFYLPETSEPARFTYKDCSTDDWALYSDACEHGASSEYCVQNSDGTYSLMVSVSEAGEVLGFGG